MFKLKIFLLFFGVIFISSCLKNNENKIFIIEKVHKPNFNHKRTRLIIKTFLGNEKRNYYGNYAPSNLKINWKINLGTNKTRVGKDTFEWSGAGWTGQPLIVQEDSVTYLLQGSFSHNLIKVRAKDGKVIWKYKFDDVIKGTGTIWRNEKAKNEDEKIIILQGSRLGLNNSLRQKVIDSYRAISFFSGKELWRLNSKKTACYSRDVDGSALILNDTAYIGLENGYFTVFNPNPQNADSLEGIFQPKIYEQHLLYKESDRAVHGGNLVTESSPSRLGNRVYVSSGSGHIYGYNLKTHKIDWDFFTGSDIDGSVIITDDSCLIVSIEKQYIRGHGGVLKLDPSKPANTSCVKWFFPTQYRNFATWKGGVIGSVSINDFYRKKDTKIPNLACFTAIDKHLYVVKTKKITGKKVSSPSLRHKYNTPELVFKYDIGGAISTPIIVGNKIVAAGYSGIYLFEFDENLNFKLLEHLDIGSVEATPVVHNGKIYIAARSGLLYSLGN